MAEQDATEAGIEIPAGGQRKPWRTPHVIVSDAAHSEVKGPPAAEGSPFFSPATGTGS